MKIHFSLTPELILDAIESGDNIGYCIVCGTEHYNVETDAREYDCEVCDMPTVFGAEEILFIAFS